MDLTPIQTSYKGYLFRSRLEARWAVFFDAMEIPWEYEKEGFDLGEDGYYLPDFWLPDIEIWFEVKGGKSLSDKDYRKIRALADLGRPVILALGNIGSEVMTIFCNDASESSGGTAEYHGQLYNNTFFIRDSLKYRTLYDGDWEQLTFVSEGYPINPSSIAGGELSFAYYKSRRARFEFGENG